MAPAFVEAGIAFASLNYLLAPAGSIGAMIDQVRRALAWLYRHAAELGIDSGRIVVAGHSAGGHLVAMALATDCPALADDLPHDLLAGGCAISGVYGLEPIRLRYHTTVLNVAPPAVVPLVPLPASPRPAPPRLPPHYDTARCGQI